MQEVITKFETAYRKSALPQTRSGDTVRVHQKIREGDKERIQIFEGQVIRTRKLNSLQAAITVRKVASGVGVEKIFPLHSPNVVKLEVVRHSRVRRNYLSYLRKRAGRAAKLQEREATLKEKAAKDTYEKSQIAAEPPKEKAEDTQEAETKKEATEKKPQAKAEKPGKLEKSETKKEAPAKTDKAPAGPKDKKAKAEAFRKAQAKQP